MRLVLVEKRLDRVERIVPTLQKDIEKIVIYQTTSAFEKSLRQYRNNSLFFARLLRVDAWDIFETLERLYAQCDSNGNPQYAFLFNLCLEDEWVPFDEKLSVSFIRSKERLEQEHLRCFIYSTFDRMQQRMEECFGRRVVKTDFERKNILLASENKALRSAVNEIVKT